MIIQDIVFIKVIELLVSIKKKRLRYSTLYLVIRFLKE
uniref:Uncharacterized protein n=1 Tax=Myoviridae sp. ctkfK18 TaxID=2825165 RepID=A0A8S5VGQ4_9CAUD|nr:MAG TPA: hypothetical protein [Myoviridae sp. ctkfK18]